MDKGVVQVICGSGLGKTSMALGKGIGAMTKNQRVIMIQFLKGRLTGRLDYFGRLEPEVKVFRFEKMDRYYEDLSESEQEEENLNILNGVNFAKKVLTIGECDVLVLDEILGLVDLGILDVSDVIHLIHTKPEEMELILTGRNLPEKLVGEADYISRIDIVKKADCEA